MRHLLAVLLFVVATSAEAKKDPLPHVEMALVGPKKITVTPIDAQKIQLLPDAQYEMAKEFAASFGEKFLDLVVSKLNPDSKTQILVNEQSAEHLGTLLEIGLAKRNLLDRVHIQYVDLSAEKIKTWRAVRNHGMRIGLGPIPYGWEQEFAAEHGTVEELADSFRNLIDEEQPVLVIDNGLEGAAAEAVGAVIRYWRPEAPSDSVKGIQLAHSTNYEFRHDVQIHVLADQPGMNKPDVERWAWMISESAVLKQEKHAAAHIFQKSSKIGSRPDRALENYKATLLGLYDGTKDLCNSDLTVSQSETRATLR